MAGLSDKFDEAVDLAKESIESGRALKRLEGLVKISEGDHERYERVVERYAEYA